MQEEILTKKCTKCQEVKSISEFTISNKYNCKICQKHHDFERNHSNINNFWQQQNKILPLEKTKENLNICWICGEKLKNHMSIAIHCSRIHHLKSEQYYIIFYKKENEGKCIICNSNTPFFNHKKGYQKTCSISCGQKMPETRAKMEKTVLEKYGTKIITQSEHFKKVAKETWMQIYGVDNPSKSQDIQNKKMATNIKKCGKPWESQTKHFRNKVIATNLQKYGVENPMQNKDILEKTQNTNLQRYGVKSVTQCKEIFEKQQKGSYQTTPYKLPSGNIINKRGYESQFLDYIFKNNILTENEINYSPDKINYTGIDNQNHYYFPDFYIPKWNLIVEIKSTWTMITDKNVYLKAEEVIKQGFKYIRILNNSTNKSKLDFTEFNNYIKTFLA